MNTATMKANATNGHARPRRRPSRRRGGLNRKKPWLNAPRRKPGELLAGVENETLTSCPRLTEPKLRGLRALVGWLAGDVSLDKRLGESMFLVDTPFTDPQTRDDVRRALRWMARIVHWREMKRQEYRDAQRSTTPSQRVPRN